jgi:hypothetical protein
MTICANTPNPAAFAFQATTCSGCERHAHVHDLVVPIRALDPNADQRVIKQANSIATPEEAFSLRQLLIAAANPRRSSPTLDACPTKDAEHETAPECRQPTAATVR